MHKYLVIFKIVFANSIIYRFALIFDTFQSFFTPFLMLTALSFAKSTSIQYDSLLPYYLAVAVLGPIVRPKVHEQLYEITRTGEVGSYLSKPLSLYAFLFSTWSCQKIINLIALSPLLLVTYVSYLINFISLSNVILTIPLSFLLYFNLSYLCGLLSFWLDEFWAISNLFDVALTILAGVILPYQFFPRWLSTILVYTPFPYTANWLARSVFDQLHAYEVFLSILWILITYICCLFLEKQATKHYSLIGN